MRNFEYFAGGSTEEGETPPTIEEVHEKKLVGYLNNDGDIDYIKGDNGKDWSEVTDEDKKEVLEKFIDDEDKMKVLEKELLASIPLPKDKTSIYQIFQTIENKDSRNVLACFTHSEDEDFIPRACDIDTFIDEYPTPFDFEEPANYFLHKKRAEEGDARAQDFNVAMADLCGKVYGKRYEYYESIKVLDKDVEKYKQDIYAEALKNISELPIADAGVYSIGCGENGRANEDAYYCNKSRSTFGVFDGTGGMGGAALAANAAVNMTGNYVDSYDIKTPEDIRNLLVLANNAVRDTLGAETASGVIGKLVKENGQKKLLYGCVGNSRIYVIRDGDAIQVTKDENNALGKEQAQVEQFGDFGIQDDDKVMLCTNGITGSEPKDEIPSKELAMMVLNASSAEDAAKNLADRATKNDDKTAIVVEI